MGIINKSLNERARFLGLATDFPGINRAQRRHDLTIAVKQKRREMKTLNVMKTHKIKA